MNVQTKIRDADRKACTACPQAPSLDRYCHQPSSPCGQSAPLVQAEIEVRQQERRRMGRELHDSTAQTLVALQLKVLYLKEMSDDPRYRGALTDVENSIRDLHQEIRAVSLLNGLPPLAEGALPAALADMCWRLARLTGLRISFEMRGDFRPCPTATETSLYRIAQEALANVVRHAHAAAVAVRLESLGQEVRLVVEDDGVGIQPRHRRSGGLGLENLALRTRELGGRLTIRRRKRGSRFAVTIPLPAIDDPVLVAA